MTGQPYTHAAHYERCVAAAKLGQVITHQHVQVLKKGVHYCARILSSWTTADGLDCWTVESISPEIAHFTVPCKQVRLCGDARCSCLEGAAAEGAPLAGERLPPAARAVTLTPPYSNTGGKVPKKPKKAG